MPVTEEKRTPTKLLKEKLEKNKQDEKKICRLVQEDLKLGGSARYYKERDGAKIELRSEYEYLVFLIGGGFTVGDSSTVYTGNGIGYPVSGESILRLEKKTVAVIISPL